MYYRNHQMPYTRNTILGGIRSQLVSRYEGKSSRKVKLRDDYINSLQVKAIRNAYVALTMKVSPTDDTRVSLKDCRIAADVAIHLREYINAYIVDWIVDIYYPVEEMFPEGHKCMRDDFLLKRLKRFSRFNIAEIVHEYRNIVAKSPQYRGRVFNSFDEFKKAIRDFREVYGYDPYTKKPYKWWLYSYNYK